MFLVSSLPPLTLDMWMVFKKQRRLTQKPVLAIYRENKTVFAYAHTR